VHHYIGALQTIIDEAGSEMEVSTDVEGFVVVGGYVEGIGDIGFGV
jgi:hypothetical protein